MNKNILEYMICKKDGVLNIRNTQINMDVAITSPEGITTKWLNYAPLTK